MPLSRAKVSGGIEMCSCDERRGTMPVTSFAEIQAVFQSRVSRIVWCNMTTVDVRDGHGHGFYTPSGRERLGGLPPIATPSKKNTSSTIHMSRSATGISSRNRFTRNAKRPGRTHPVRNSVFGSYSRTHHHRSVTIPACSGREGWRTRTLEC